MGESIKSPRHKVLAILLICLAPWLIVVPCHEVCEAVNHAFYNEMEIPISQGKMLGTFFIILFILHVVLSVFMIGRGMLSWSGAVVLFVLGVVWAALGFCLITYA